MNKKLPQNIRKVLAKGELVPYEKVWKSYSKREREEIEKRARYLKAAMELRKLRKQLHLSQEQLAKKISVKREFISRIESGRQNVTLETLYRIAQATGKQFTLSFR
ncbi:MAG: helix-turn-helix transcriptional regulator [bacterium]|nr:helix-turn-helix transcriptional regulator [bacterium]